MCSNTTHPVVVITRAAEQSAGFESALRQRGLEPFLFPVIETETVLPSNEVTATFFELFAEQFNWIFFSSENGVSHFVNYLKNAGLECEIPEITKLAVVGDKTDQVVRETFGRYADRKPTKFDAQALLECFNSSELRDSKVLIVRGDKGRDVLNNGLRAKGANVSEVTLYRTVINKTGSKEVESLLNLDVNRLVFSFFSPSAFTGTLEILGANAELLSRAKIASIGSVTSDAIKQAGYKVWLESSKASEGVLATEIARALQI